MKRDTSRLVRRWSIHRSGIRSLSDLSTLEVFTWAFATFIRIVREPQLLRLYVTSEGTPQVSAPLIQVPQFELRTPRFSSGNKASIQDTCQPEEVRKEHGVSKLNLTAHLPQRAAGAIKGGSRSATLAVPLFLTLVPYSFTMRVNCA